MEEPLKPPSKELVFPPSVFVAPSREELMEDVQGAIERAFEARSEFICQETNTVTLGRVRRMLEKDLNVETGFLETHKELVTGLTKKLLQGPEDHSPETEKVIDGHSKGKEKLIEEPEPEPELELEPEPEPEPELESKEAKEDLKPKRKRLKKKADSEGMKDDVMMPPQVVDAGEEVKLDIEGRIWEAAHKRASQFKAQAETLTVKTVRRILEEDLEFEKGGLDTYKDHVRAALDEILNSEDPEDAENPEDAESLENEEPAPVTKPKKTKAAALESTKKAGKKRKAVRGEEVEKSDTIEGEETRKARKDKKSKKKVVEVVEVEDEDASEDAGDGGESNEKGRSSAEESDDEKPEQKKVSKAKPVESKPVYSRKVEHLRNIIKDCGITVPPNVYRKAKQAGESRRESIMIKELEAILSKEGLTGSASKDDIKAVRKRKEKLKDLEGMDTSNIIDDSRGRRSRTSASSFFAPVQKEIVDLGDEDEDEDGGEDEDGDDDDDDTNDNSDGDPNVELQDDDDDED